MSESGIDEVSGRRETEGVEMMAVRTVRSLLRLHPRSQYMGACHHPDAVARISGYGKRDGSRHLRVVGCGQQHCVLNRPGPLDLCTLLHCSVQNSDTPYSSMVLGAVSGICAVTMKPRTKSLPTRIKGKTRAYNGHSVLAPL